MMRDKEDRYSSRSWWMARGAIVLLAALVFGNVLFGDLLGFDDRFHIVQNSSVMGNSWGTLVDAWRGQYGNLYIPVAYTVWGVVVRVGQSASDGTFAAATMMLHGLSLVLHIGCGLIVLSLARKLGLGVWGAVVCAAVFCVHPVQVESVAWISEGRGLLAAALGLAAVRMFLECVGDSGAGRKWIWGAIGTGLGLLALMSKPSAAMIVGVAAVLMLLLQELGRGSGLGTSGWGRLQIWERLRLLGWLVPLGTASAAALIITSQLQPGGGLPDSTALWTRPLIAADALGFYVRTLLFPWGLTPDYGRTPAAVMRSGWVYAAWLVPVGAVMGMWVLVRRSSRHGDEVKRGQIWMAACTAIVVGTLLPVLGLVNFDHQAISTVADRYLYVGMLGAGLGIGCAAEALRRRWRWGTVIGAAVLIGAWGGLSVRQVGVWKSDLTLWTHGTEVQPGARAAWNNKGMALQVRGDVSGAEKSFRRAVEIEPRFSLARANLGWALLEQERDVEARPWLEGAVEITPKNARALSGLGLVELRAGRPALAVELLSKAIEVPNPHSVDAQTLANLGAGLLQIGEPERARVVLERAIKIEPTRGEAQHNLGLALRDLGRVEEAIAVWSKAIAAGSVGSATKNQLGDLLIKAGRTDEARQVFEGAVQHDGLNAYAMNNLGMLSVQAGNLPQAERWFARAVEAAPAMRTARDNLERARLLLKEQGPKPPATPPAGPGLPPTPP